MITKQKIKLLVLIAIFTTSISFTNANSEVLTRGELFEEIGVQLNVPNSYKYIDLYYNDVNKASSAYIGLQKLVYDNRIENLSKNIYLNKPLTNKEFYTLLSKFGNDYSIKKEILAELKGYAKDSDLSIIKTIINKTEKTTIKVITTGSDSNIKSEKLKILNDVYDTLKEKHFNSEEIKEGQLINSAIEGLAKGVGDKHTSYFPPTKNKSFQEGLGGEYEGIGSYVDMPKPGVVSIISPISGGPAEKAGLKGGDIITKVDGKEITKDYSLSEVVSWIKGPAGTYVELTIDRDGKTIIIEVKRAKIVISDIEGELLNSKTYYIKMKMFTSNIGSQFKDELKNIEQNKKVKKIIIDLRNNPGGYLDQVVEILGYFVAEGEPVTVIKYKESKQVSKSYGYTDYEFKDKKIVLLVNSGTASASEIMAGTLKDYYGDNIVIIGEQTYGKGSVQTQRYYNDGSALKYTVAKWFTGKTETGIDGVGITPDIELEFDMDLYEKKEVDNQLEKAKSIK